ncbi:hypothetical protein QUB60_29595 [Microcoleus sp. A2-C5]|uniref:hypothetical protein n=1 Tax=unclassified Microcoleus TaxID=2642155 RepID=UPI002FD50ED5
MHQKPPTAIGRSHLFNASISALKLRADELGLTHYASLYGDKRKRETWLKLLEHEPDLQPLQPRPQFSKFKKSDYQLPHRRHYAIVLSVAAIALLWLAKPLLSKVSPIQLDIKIQLTGQK